jgi:hypothetical protein
MKIKKRVATTLEYADDELSGKNFLAETQKLTKS